MLHIFNNVASSIEKRLIHSETARSQLYTERYQCSSCCSLPSVQYGQLTVKFCVTVSSRCQFVNRSATCMIDPTTTGVTPACTPWFVWLTYVWYLEIMGSGLQFGLQATVTQQHVSAPQHNTGGVVSAEGLLKNMPHTCCTAQILYGAGLNQFELEKCRSMTYMQRCAGGVFLTTKSKNGYSCEALMR